MASVKRRLPCNVPGEFFVDDSCIDCSVCRTVAPSVFGDGENTACVRRQPSSREEKLSAFQALVSCPVSAIGVLSKKVPKEVHLSFPIPIEDEVYLTGYSSKDSYGALSYFIRHGSGNWLIDSPRFNPHIVRRLEEMGGLRYILLTHEDDIADSERFADHFGAERIIHEGDSHAVPDAEIVLRGSEPVEIEEDFLVIPTPGHTRGHICLLYRGKFLFTGDHLAWSRRRKRLVAFRDYCWYSWEELKASMLRLLDFEFEFILPGHGYMKRVSRKEFESFVKDLVSS